MHRWKRFLIVSAAALIGLAAACDSNKSGDKSEESKAEQAKAESPEEGDKKDESADKKDDELPYEATGPVAKVNGNEITAEDFNELVRRMHGNSRRPLPASLAKRFKGKTLDQAIEKHLIDNQVEEAGIEISDEDIKAEMKRFKDRFPNEKAFQSFMKFRNMTEEKMRSQITESLKVKKLLKEKKGIEVTEEDAKKYYENNPKEFEQSEQVKASHILLKTKKDASDEEVEKAKKKAQELAKKARKEGADFAKLAKENSEGPSAKKGGDLGYFTKERMVEEFSKKAFSMENGEISDPVKTRFGFHVIKRTGHKEASTKSFEEAKSDILSKLESKELRKAMDAFVKELKKDAEIEKMPDNIKVNAEPKKQGGGKGVPSIKGLEGAKKKLKLKMKNQGGSESAGSEESGSTSGESEGSGSAGEESGGSN
jgi:peptidyl-prolyl cis-trans isomerase C